MKRNVESTRGLWGPILRETFRAWIERDAFTQSAALAFFALFSLAPVLVLFAAGAGLLFDPAAVRHQIVGQFELLMGHEQALAVDAMLGHAAFEMSGILGRIIGIATFAVGTLAVFVQLQDSLNKMWDVAPKPGPLIRKLLWKRVISFALVLALGFVLVVSLVLSATIHALQSFAERFATLPSSVFETGNALVTYVLVTLLFAMLYRILPDVEIPWRDVWVGAILTALLLSVGEPSAASEAMIRIAFELRAGTIHLNEPGLVVPDEMVTGAAAPFWYSRWMGAERLAVQVVTTGSIEVKDSPPFG